MVQYLNSYGKFKTIFFSIASQLDLKRLALFAKYLKNGKQKSDPRILHLS